jgi:hypothetical protein
MSEHRRLATATELLARQHTRLLESLRIARIAAWHLLAFQCSAFRLDRHRDATLDQVRASHDLEGLGQDAYLLRRLLERFIDDGCGLLPAGLNVGERHGHPLSLGQAETRRLSRLLRSWFDQPAADVTTRTEQADADEPTVVAETECDPHAATVHRWARLLALVRATVAALLEIRDHDDPDLWALMVETDSMPDRTAPGEVYEQCSTAAVNLRAWLAAVLADLPLPIEVVAEGLAVEVVADVSSD